MSIETTTTAALETLETTEAQKANYSCPDSTLILRADAPQEAWLEARTQGLGGSDISGIVGLNKWNPAYRVWLSKIGEAPEVKMSQALRMGKLMEPILKQMFTEDTGIRVRASGLMRSKEHPFMQVTVDGLTEDGGIFESKTSTGWLSSEWEDDQVPDHAELQVQHGMAVTGRSHAWVVGLLDGREWFIRRIERDDALIAQIIDIERDFWTNHVLTRIEPPVNHMAMDTLKERYSEADLAKFVPVELNVLQALKDRYDAAGLDVKAAEAAKDSAAAEIRAIVGDGFGAKVAGTDDIFTKLANDGPFSERKFRENHPELFEELQVETTKLDMDTLKEKHADLYTKCRARVLRFPKIKAAKAGK